MFFYLKEQLQHKIYYKKYELLYPFYSQFSKDLKAMPKSYWDYSISAKDIAEKKREYGISGYYRLYNEEDFCEASVKSYLPFFDEIILVYDSSTTDKTPEIVKKLANTYPKKIKYYFYQPPVLGKLMHPFFKFLPANHPYSLVNYYNYSLSKTTKQIVTKLDGDQIAIVSEFEKLKKKFTKENFPQNDYYTFGCINLYSFQGRIYVDPENYLCGFDDHTYCYLKKERCYYQKIYSNKKCYEGEYFSKKSRNRKNAGILFFHLKFMRSNIAYHSYRGLSSKEHQKRFRKRILQVKERWVDWKIFVNKFRTIVMENTGTDIAKLPHPETYLKKWGVSI